MSAAVLRMEHSLGNALRHFRAGGNVTTETRSMVWIDDLLREASVLFAPIARAKNVALELPAEDVTIGVYGDEELLRQIVVNLISNALKYTPDGGQVRLKLSADKRNTYIRVADTGRGIRAEDQPHLFTKFYRTDEGSRHERIPGTGLGLSIALKAAQAHGGTIAVQSQIGHGSVFTVSLPKTAPSQEAA